MDTHAATVTPEDISVDELKQYMFMSVQANALAPHKAMKLQIEAQADIRQAVLDYYDEMEEKERQQQEQNAKMQEQQLQAQQQMQQSQMDGQQAILQQQEQSAMNKQKVKSTTDWQKKKMDVDSKKYIEQLKLANQGNV